MVETCSYEVIDDHCLQLFFAKVFKSNFDFYEYLSGL